MNTGPLPFHWEMFHSALPRRRDWSSGIVVTVGIRPGPPAVLVLRQRSGTETTHPLSSVTALRPLTVGYRSTEGSGESVLELRVGRRTYRTRAAFNPPANDVRLLADALRLACPWMVVGEHEDRTTWVTDAG
ncbi:hypothetical protein ACH4SP_00185 [Streptomyces sp. NPDC021093]|uniref:hypothetical protein n=1 Tax=Streptomyces sp. NPDC021093 TaxID=3365112 RepID=UPI0037A23DE5